MTAPSHARMVTRAQQGAIHGLFRGVERDDRLAQIGDYLGRAVESTSDLSQDEASLIIDWATRHKAAW